MKLYCITFSKEKPRTFLESNWQLVALDCSWLPKKCILKMSEKFTELNLQYVKYDYPKVIFKFPNYFYLIFKFYQTSWATLLRPKFYVRLLQD